MLGPTPYSCYIIKCMNADLSDIKNRLITDVDSQSAALEKIALDIHANPELGFKEYRAVQLLIEYFRNTGFQIEQGLCGLDTAFRATFGKGKPTIAFLGEYDALPDIGHGCGHNLIAASSAGAAVAGRYLAEYYGGQIQYIGTPAEELFGGKITLCQRGGFEGLDAVMMVHPESGKSVAMANAMACTTLYVEYFGLESHAAAEPHAGINALDAIIIGYNAISALRQHIKSGSRIHGVITDGGAAPNVVPGHSAGTFLVRASTVAYLEELKNKVLNCFRAGEQATGARLKYRWDPIIYEPLKNNNALAKLFVANYEKLGHDIELADPSAVFGSTDMGNVSQLVPGLHAFVSIAPSDVAGHTKEFARAAGGEIGLDVMKEAAKALAMTAADLFANPVLVKDVKREFEHATVMA